MSWAPSEQFMLTASGRACSIDARKASMVWPESVRPLLSVMVTEMMTGTRAPRAANVSSMAHRHALAFMVSKMVSATRRSAPPSRRPRTCSAVGVAHLSKLTARRRGPRPWRHRQHAVHGPDRAGEA